MKRLKTFGIYILLIITFFFFSRVLIFIGLNNTYDNIKLIGTIPEGVSVTSSKATSVNGEVKGEILEGLNSKYIKFNFYTDIGSLAGSYYLDTSELKNSDFEFYYKLNYINSYSVELTNEKPTEVNLDNFSLEQYKSYTIFGLLIVAMFI